MEEYYSVITTSEIISMSVLLSYFIIFEKQQALCSLNGRFEAKKEVEAYYKTFWILFQKPKPTDGI